MKIVLITFVTPCSENVRGTSALPYHLIKGINLAQAHLHNKVINASTTIYTFNNNRLSKEKVKEVEQELGVTIKQIPLPKWYLWMFKLHLLFLRVFLKYPFVNYIKLPQRYMAEIKNHNPDLIWVMGEELSRIARQFPNFQRIHIGPDTESLYYYRMIGQRFVMNNVFDYWKCAIMYRKYARMEREFPPDENYTYLAVGEEDVRHLRQLNPKVKTKFLRHPHYDVNPNVNPNPNVNHNSYTIKFHQPKIKLLIAGRYDLYMKQEGDLLVERLVANANLNLNPNPNLNLNANPNSNGNRNDDFLRSHYSITFLGKGWEKHVKELQDSGWEVNHITFAPDYIEEICKHDIQITPITIGTGTKGKVLDALANGLLVIGTPYAMENIAVVNGVSCIEYRYPKEVIDILHDIPINREKYETMAREGQKSVLEYHDRSLLSKKLFSL